MALSFIFSLLFGAIYLPCLCYEGHMTMKLASIFWGLYVARWFLAILLKENNRSWVLYVVLILIMPLWVSAAVEWTR